MYALATINDPLKFPGADHVSPQNIDGYAVYGAAKDGKHKAIALLRMTTSGKYLVQGTPTVINKLGLVTSVTAVQALVAWPIYETIVEVITFGRPNSMAVHIGSKPTGVTHYGRKIISTKLAIGWTLQRMLDMEYQIEKPNDELIIIMEAGIN